MMMTTECEPLAGDIYAYWEALLFRHHRLSRRARRTLATGILL